MPIAIERADLAERGHCEGILEILDSYAREPAGGSAPLRPDVRERLIPALRADTRALVLLALEEARPIGVAVCFVGFSTFAARPLLNLHDLAVLPARRGRGAGRALLGAVEEHARRLGCCKITLEVLESNTRARALYDREGFAGGSPGALAVPTLFLSKPLPARE